MRIASWVKTADHAGFPFTRLPAHVAIPMLPCLMHFRLWTVGIAAGFTLLVWYMDRKGYTLTWAARRISGRLIGNRVSARSMWWLRRTSVLKDPAR